MTLRLVTLTTDFGTRDPFAGLMKVQLLARCPEARIVDLTHEIPAFRPAAAAFWLERVPHWCPAGTVHVAVVDPGVGTARRLLVVEAFGQWFLAPDNGLLGGLLLRPEAVVHEIAPECTTRFALGARSATFHGRDVLAPLAGELAAGRATPADLGPRITDAWREPGRPAAACAARAGADGVVIWVDRYGNAYTSLAADRVAADCVAALEVAGRTLPLLRTYGDAAPGTAIALVNSFGVVEVAVVQGSAAEVLRLEVGTPVRLVVPHA
jgi:S-adenosylmethionine hydrolase